MHGARENGYIGGMNANCPFCKTGVPAQIALAELNLRICPQCLATFLPSTQYAALRRNVFIETRRLWLKVLQERGQQFAQPTELHCIDHHEPLAPGAIADYGYEGWVPTCCDIQHLAPATMIQILEFGLKLSEVGFESQYAGKKPRGLAAFLGGILFRFIDKPSTEDGLDTMQYNFKFRDVLGPIPGEKSHGI